MNPEEEVFNEVFGHALDLMKDYNIELIAGTLMAVAVRLYRTSLNNKDFKKMMKSVSEADPAPYNIDKKTIH